MNDTPTAGFFRQDEPPEGGRVQPLLRVEDAKPILVCILTPKWEGYFHHWHNGMSYRCSMHEGACAGCDPLQAPKKWCGYLDVCSADGRGGSFLQMTPDGVTNLLVQKNNREDLRGMLVHVRRARNDMKCPLVFTYTGEYSGALVLRKPRSVIPTLKRLWKEFAPPGHPKRKRVN